MEPETFRYAAAPLLAWLASGSLKFAVNSLRARRPAFDLIGYGGLPSTHAAIVMAPATLVALHLGVGHPAFGVALALVIVVVLDARSLRGAVGAHAAALNALRSDGAPRLRERMGHRAHELAAGLAVGGAVGWLLA
jgi:hypothetical protein